MKLDIMDKIHPVVAIAPVNSANNTPIDSVIIDTQGYQSLAFIIALGVLLDAASFAVTMTHGNQSNLSDGAAVPSNMMNGTLALAGFIGTDDSKTRKIGYVGDKRYVRLTITPSANTGSLIAAIAVLGNAEVAPPPNPPM